jgi:hypothetical protein
MKKAQKIVIFLLLVLGLMAPLFPQFNDYFGAQLIINTDEVRESKKLLANARVVDSNGSLMLDLSRYLRTYDTLYRLHNLGTSNPSLAEVEEGEDPPGTTMTSFDYLKWFSLSNNTYYRLEVFDSKERERIMKEIDDEIKAEQETEEAELIKAEEKKKIQEALDAKKELLRSRVEAARAEEEAQKSPIERKLDEARRVLLIRKSQREESKEDQQKTTESEEDEEIAIASAEETASTEEQNTTAEAPIEKTEEEKKAEERAEIKKNAGRVAWLTFQALKEVAKKESINTAFQGESIPKPAELLIQKKSQKIEWSSMSTASSYVVYIGNQQYRSPSNSLHLDWENEPGNTIDTYKVCYLNIYGVDGGCSPSVSLEIDFKPPGEEEFILTLSSTEDGIYHIGDAITIETKNIGDSLYYYYTQGKETSRIQRAFATSNQQAKKTFIVKESWAPETTINWYMKDKNGNISRNFSQKVTVVVEDP